MSEGKKAAIIKDIFGDCYGSGSEMLFHCPKCEHHKRKLSINIEKDAWKCWVCDWSGRKLTKIVRRYGDLYHKKKWSELVNKIDVSSFEEKMFGLKEEEPEQRVELPKEFKSLANKVTPRSAGPALRYLKERGIKKDDIIRWKIGYCEEGEFARRIIIPSFSLNGHSNYFIARSYDGHWKRYLNPKASRNIVFNHLFLDFEDDLTIVEGAFDAIVAGPNAVPLLGSTLRETSKLFQEIARNDTTVYMALDPDAKDKENKIIELLLKYGIQVYKVNLNDYDDVGEMSPEDFKKRKENASFVEDKFYLLMEKALSL
jgi:DNA primase